MSEAFDFISRLSVGLLYLVVALGSGYHSNTVRMYGRRMILRLTALASVGWGLFYLYLAFVGPPPTVGLSRVLHGFVLGLFFYQLWTIRFYDSYRG